MDWNGEISPNTNTRCGKLIQIINNMAKKPTVEAPLSETLDKFISQLEEDDKYLINGIFNTNFAEAALFLQSSVDLYVKKVDVLWEAIVNYQKHIITYQKDKNEEEIQKVNERQEKYKRKRKRTEDEKQETAAKKKSKTHNVTDYSEQVINYFAENQEIDETLMDNWKAINENDIQKNVTDKLKGSDATLFRPTTEILCQEDEEYTAKYNQLTLSSALEEIFGLEESGQLLNLHNGINRMRLASYIVNDFRRNNNIRFDQPEHTFVNKLNCHINNFMNKKQNDHNNKSIESSIEDYINFQETSDICDINNVKLTRLSVTDAIITTKSNETVNLSKTCINTLAKLSADIILLYTKDPRICEKIRRISVGEKIPLCEMQHSLYNNEHQPKDLKSCENTLSQSTANCDSVFQDSFVSDCNDNLSDDDDDICTMPVLEDMSALPVIAPISCNELCCGNSSVTPTPPRLKPIKMLPDKPSVQLKKTELVVKEKRPRRISQKMIMKLTTGITVPAKSFERFYRRIYSSADGEGDACEEDCDATDSDEELQFDHDYCISPITHNNCDSDDEPLSRIQDSGVCDLDVIFPDSEENESYLPVGTNDISGLLNQTQTDIALESDSLVDETEEDQHLNINEEAETIEEESSQPVSAPEFFDNNTDLTDLEISRKNVRSWQMFIKNKLKTLENKSDFDIHEYASKLIDGVPLNETKVFGDLVQNKSSAEVTRHFTAALQLANTENIEISGAIPGQLSNDTFSITVLSKERYHEKLKDYQAPSEETFNQRFAKAQALNPRVRLHSTPITHSSHKKAKHSFSGKKLNF